MPSCPMLLPAEAAACQVWAATPGTKVAVPKPMVGTFQLTSPASVEADGAVGSKGRSGRMMLVWSRLGAAPWGRVFWRSGAGSGGAGERLNARANAGVV